MMHTNKQYYPYLTFSGAIPFVFCVLLLAFGVDNIAYIGHTETIIATYGLVIISFLAGSHWGIHVMLNDKPINQWNVILPIISNVITLAAWLSYLTLTARTTLIVLAIGFLVLLIIDYTLKNDMIISQKYYRIRGWISAIVITSLFLAAMIIE